MVNGGNGGGGEGGGHRFEGMIVTRRIAVWAELLLKSVRR